MLTDVQLLNNGLSKISASRIDRIDPPRTPLEKYMAANYEQWKRAELAKRRWVFAMEKYYKLTLQEKIPGIDKPYKYALPIDCLRPIRHKRAEWEVRGKFVYSNNSQLRIDYIRNVPESDFDALFNEVLACKIAYESTEYVNQSTSKKQGVKMDYDEAVEIAGKANAFIIGPENVGDEDSDEDYTFLGAWNG